MQDVEFEKLNYPEKYNESTSKIVGLVIKLGAKNENQANIILLGITILFILITIFLVIPEKDISLDDLPPGYTNPEDINTTPSS